LEGESFMIRGGKSQPLVGCASSQTSGMAEDHQLETTHRVSLNLETPTTEGSSKEIAELGRKARNRSVTSLSLSSQRPRWPEITATTRTPVAPTTPSARGPPMTNKSPASPSEYSTQAPPGVRQGYVSRCHRVLAKILLSYTYLANTMRHYIMLIVADQ